jgi:uncharacterized membrane protein
MNVPPATPGQSFAAIAYSAGVNGPYALCDKCHDLTNQIVANRSFRQHRRHIVDVGTSCSVCHAAHGVQNGTAATNSHLINFDTRIVAANRGEISWNEARSSCTLRCHGHNH